MPVAEVQQPQDVVSGDATERTADDAADKSDEATTQTVFVTRPTTTVVEATEHIDDNADAEEKVTTEQPTEAEQVPTL